MCTCEKQKDYQQEGSIPLAYGVLADRIEQMSIRMEEFCKTVKVAFSVPIALTKSEACIVLKVSQKTLDRILQRGELPSFRVNGNHIRIMPDHLMNYIKSNQS